jgi:diacylglycerol O-acyltransferase 2, plant
MVSRQKKLTRTGTGMELVLLVLLGLVAAVSALGCALFVGFGAGMAYSRAYWDGAENDGRRAWPRFRAAVATALHLSARLYFDYEVGYATEATRFEAEKALLADGHTEGAAAALFAGHPHGLFAIASLYLLTPRSPHVGWRSLVPCIHAHVFAVPLLRDLALWFGARDVTEANLRALLGAGRSAYLVPGGCREMIIGPDTIQRKHMGFLRIAYETQRRVFPLLHRGQDAVFRTYSCAALDRLRHAMLDLTGYPLPSFFLGPFPAKLSTLVLEPLDPCHFTTVEEFIDAYYDRLDKAHHTTTLTPLKAQ